MLEQIKDAVGRLFLVPVTAPPDPEVVSVTSPKPAQCSIKKTAQANNAVKGLPTHKPEPSTKVSERDTKSIRVGNFEITPAPLVKPEKDKTVSFIKSTRPQFGAADRVTFRVKRRPISRRGNLKITPRMPRLG